MQMTMMAGIKEVKFKNLNQSSIFQKFFYHVDYSWGPEVTQVLYSPNFSVVCLFEIAKINNGSATVHEFIQALVGGYQMAYRAVMDPVEGTILTVA